MQKPCQPLSMIFAVPCPNQSHHRFFYSLWDIST